MYPEKLISAFRLFKLWSADEKRIVTKIQGRACGFHFALSTKFFEIKITL
jgi:hypothetical protein